MNLERTLIALEEQGLTAARLGRCAEAVQIQRQALGVALRIRRPRLIAVVLNRLGQALDASGQVQSALTMYERGCDVLAKGSDLSEVLEGLRPAAAELPADGEPGGPELRGASAVAPLDEAEADAALPLSLLLNLGNAHLALSEETPALRAFEQLLARPETAQAPVLRLHALTGIALVQRCRDDIRGAYASLSEALDGFDRHAAPHEKRRALAAMAGIHRDRGQGELALSLYRQSLALYARAEDPRSEAHTYAGLGHCLREMKQDVEARRAFERALDLFRRAGVAEPPWQVQWGLGCCLLATGEPAAAARAFRHSLELIGSGRMEPGPDEGTIAIDDGVQGVFGDLIEATVGRAQTEPGAWRAVLAVVEEAQERALHDLLGSRRRKRLPEGRVFRQIRFRPFPEGAQMSAGLRAGAGDVPDSATDARMAPVAPLEPPAEVIPVPRRQGAPNRFDAFSRASQAVGDRPDECVAIVDPQPLARLVFRVLSDQIVVLAVSPQGEVRGHTVRWSRAELATRVWALRHALQADQGLRGLKRIDVAGGPAGDEPEDYTALLAEWYDALVAPVADALPAGGTPLAIEPHVALWLVPFAALIDEKGDWLADRWPLLYTPSWQTLDEIRREPDYGGPSALNVLVVGDPLLPRLSGADTRGLRLEQLPGAGEEAQAVAELFPKRSTLLLGPGAHRHTVEPLLREHGILHLATHCIALADSPLASFVVLGGAGDNGGLLTARQIMSLSLPADLVTLSACQTGLDTVAGEGIVGLSRAFLLAGARTVLASQWNVSDRATVRLMKSFYHWYLSRDDKALALQSAMRELRARPGYEHPRFWAPFVVIGAEI